MTARPSVARAVSAALKAVIVKPDDQGAVALARRYASLLDEATPKAKYAAALRQLARGLDRDDERAAEAFRVVSDALAEHSVASDLGPKLLAVLTALRMTPAGRGAKGGDGGGSPIATQLDEFTARRARKHGA